MATCITPTWGNANAPQVRLTVTQSSSTASTATLSWKLEYLADYAVSTSVAKAYTVEIAGKSVKTGTFAINGLTGTHTIASGTETINKTTSAQTVVFSCSMTFNLTWGGTYGGTKSATGNISVAAKTSYKISYNANGGSGAPSAQTKWHGTNVTLSSSKPTRDGFIFLGWATSSTGSVAYQPGATYSANASVTLYAIWQSDSFTITYNANGGTGAPSNQTKTYGQNITLSTTEPIREGFEFVGWGTSASSTTATYLPGAAYTKNASVTLYAVWKSDYTRPRVTDYTVDRCLSDGELSDEGTYVKVAFGWASDAIPSTIKIEWRKTTDTARAGIEQFPVNDQTSGSVSSVIGDGSIDISSEYLFTVTITDSGGTTMSTVRIGTQKYIIDILPGGTGVSFGAPASIEGAAEFTYDPVFSSTDGTRKARIQVPTGNNTVDQASLNVGMFAAGAWAGYGRLLTTTNTRMLLWSGTWASGSLTVENIDKFSMYILYPTQDLSETMIGIRSLGTSTDIMCFGITPADNVLKLNTARLRLNGTTLTRVAPRVWTITGTAITSANVTMTIYRIEGLL